MKETKNCVHIDYMYWSDLYYGDYITDITENPTSICQNKPRLEQSKHSWKQYKKIPPITQTIKSNSPKCSYCDTNLLKYDKGLNFHIGRIHPEQKIRKIQQA